MGRGFFDKIFVGIIIFSILSVYVLAAGGGGGGSSSSGLGFNSRDSVFILVNGDYSEKFSLKNGTKYGLVIKVDEGKVNVSFGGFFVDLREGDNFLDLNDDNFADMNFNLISILNEKRANIRIIDTKNTIKIVADQDILKKKQPEKEETIEEQEGEVKCGNLKTIKDRVSCRLDLEDEEQEGELELYYLPEECRPLSGSERGICIARYKSVQTCWKFPIGDERVSCVKRSMKLETIQEEKEKCAALTGQGRSYCERELKNKVYNLIKWRFYDLEERAEDFMLRGIADREDVSDFIIRTELNKIGFNEAGNNEERKEIVLNVKRDWQELVNKVKEKLRG